MSLIYRVLYGIGLLPWERDEVPPELEALVQGPDALAPGRALDLGCGTGTHAVYLAAHGWQVTAIDNVEHALQRARDRAAATGVTVDWLAADVTRLEQLGLAPGFTLLFDRGTYHGLSGLERDAYAAGVTALAAPGATMLIWATAPNRRPLEPSGADATEIAGRFASWRLRGPLVADEAGVAGPRTDAARGWYRLTRC